jgi:alpha-N-arabinofuranosidase
VAAALVDGGGRGRARADGRTAGGAAVLRLGTAGLPDGEYRLRVTAPAGGEAVERTVRLAGGAAARAAAARAAAEQRLAALAGAAPGRPGAAGHLARARTMLALAAEGDASDTALARSRRLVADAEAIVAAVRAGRRPPAAGEGFEHPAGFAADGQRGPVQFIPVATDPSPAAPLPGATVTVHTARPAAWRIGPRFYGTFSEAVVYDRPLYGWLDAQAVRNPGFLWGHPDAERTARDLARGRELDSAAAAQALAGRWLPRRAASTDSVAAPWIAVGRGADAARYAIACDTAAGRACQRITAAAGETGVAQVVALPAWRATRYRLHAVLRGDGRVRRARVRLYHAGRVVDSADVPLDTAWRAADAALTAPTVPGPVNAFLLAVTVDGPGTAELRKVTLRPADADGIFDPQAVAQLRDLRTGWVRWPGGNYASAYRWREGVGPADARPSTRNPSWPGLNDNAIGTDEFLQLGERAGFETLVTVNAGDGTPEEAAAWVQYVNGDTTTPMGRLRARHGRAAPYGVRHWNIGNELWGHWQVGYTDPEGNAERYARFARAMRAADSTIVLIANAHGGHSESPPRAWNDALLRRNGRALEWLDLHTYVGVPADSGLAPADRAFLLSAVPISYEQWIAEFAADVRGRGLGAARAIVGEYNGQVQTGDTAVDRAADLVAAAAYLHAFIRQGEFVVGANATEYSPFDPRARAFGRMHPRFDLFRTWAARAGTRPLAATVETPVAQQPRRVGRDVLPIFNVPLVDAVALRDTSTGATGVSVLNRDMRRPVTVTVRLDGAPAGGRARWHLVRGLAGGGVEERDVAASEGGAFTVTLPPHSASLLSVPAAGAAGAAGAGRGGAP